MTQSQSSSMATPHADDDFTVIHSQGCAPSDTVYGDFQRHSTAARTSTELMISSTLRSRYPDHTLTIILQYDCDILAFASAGQAEAVLDSRSDESLLYRSYVPPVRRLDGAVGYLTDSVQFAKYHCRWQNHDFLVYIVNGDRGNAGLSTSVNQYILHKSEEHGPVKPIVSATDQFITAAAQYSLALHEEVLVFDQGWWQKNHELWESVQKAAWSDVILDEKMKKSLIADVEGFFDERENYREFGVPWKVTITLTTWLHSSCFARCSVSSSMNGKTYSLTLCTFAGDKRGIIFHGPPGNGKTISIKALMKTLSTRPDPIPTLYVKTFSSFAGPEYAVRQIFVKARAEAPCLLVFEDLDSLVREGVRSYFLNEVDGLERNDGILIVGSTNHRKWQCTKLTESPNRCMSRA